MENTLLKWLLNLIQEFAKFGTWLTTPLKYINQTPLMVFSFVGLTALISILLIRLFIGG